MIYLQQPLWLASDTTTLQLSLSQWSLVPHWSATPVLCWCFKFWNHDIGFQKFSQNQRKMSSLLEEYGRIILKLRGTFHPKLNSFGLRQKIIITVQIPGENPPPFCSKAKRRASTCADSSDSDLKAVPRIFSEAAGKGSGEVGPRDEES